MKRKLLMFFLFIMFLLLPSVAMADSDYKVYVNGQQLQSDYPPIVHNDAVYIPLWALLGQSKMSAKQDNNNVMIVNTINHLLFIGPNQRLMFDVEQVDGKTKQTLRKLDYPIITQDHVIYVPLVFLGDYFGMQVAYGDNGRIDITTSKNSAPGKWNDLYDDAGMYSISDILMNNIEAEIAFKMYPTFWTANRNLGGKYMKINVYDYYGLTLYFTVDWSDQVYSHTFQSINDITDTLAIADPLEGHGWSDHTKDLIRQGKIELGMTKEQVIASWGKPYQINTDMGEYSYSEQWVYDLGNYLYFNKKEILEYMQTSSY